VATATTYARAFKITGGVITRSEKETTSNETIVSDDDTGGTLFGRVDFSYQYAASSGRVAVSRNDFCEGKCDGREPNGRGCFGEGQEAVRARLPRYLPDAVLERLSAAEWVQPGALPDGVHILGADSEPGCAVLMARGHCRWSGQGTRGIFTQPKEFVL
jgi:hypothetical protein